MHASLEHGIRVGCFAWVQYPDITDCPQLFLHLINELLVVDFWANIFSCCLVHISQRDDLGIDLFHLEGTSQDHKERGLGNSGSVGRVLRPEQIIKLYAYLLHLLG